MKKGFVPFLSLMAITLSSCALFSNATPYQKDIAVYDIDRLDNTNQLDSCYQTTVKACFKTGQDYIPYVSLKQYASLYNKHLSEEFDSEVTYGPFYDTWTISKDGSYYFICEFSKLSKEIYVGGSLEAVFKQSDDPRDLKALNYAIKTEAENKRLSEGGSFGCFSYGEYGLGHLKYDSERYYPLGLLDITLVDSTSIYFTYNYKHIFSTRDVDNYSTKYFIENGNSLSFDLQMESMVGHDVIPQYLLKYNAGLFLYTMDNFYGLKDYKNINTFEWLCRKKGFYYNLFSKDGYTRAQAYSDALSILDDNHTALISANQAWGESYFIRRRYGEGTAARSLLTNNLTQYRTNAYSSYQENGRPRPSTPEKNVLYSADGKTAMFAFDHFVFGTSEQVFNDDDTIKSTARDYDSFINVLFLLNAIKEKGGVENVILDISVNGGGIIGVLLKILALISKDNSSRFCFYESVSNQAIIYTSKIDINGDGLYDTSDCFGNDFNFYILTSDCSFSCGNAFPCIAQLSNTAKIIGQKSGGGECAVAVHYLPNSEYVYHSSNIHIGNLDETTNTFTGFENGATPDIPVETDQNFYSIENLNLLIQNAQ